MNEKDKKPNSSTNSTGCWIESDATLFCKCCINHGQSGDLPPKLKGQFRGNFGVIDKNQETFNVNKAKLAHESKELHLWCFEREMKAQANKAENEKQSEEAGLMIIMNALMCLQKAWSAEDFVGLNDKDSLNEKLKTATKNDSSAEFFHIRNLAYEILTENVRLLQIHQIFLMYAR